MSGNQTQAKNTGAKKDKVPGIKVTSQLDGFRRGGRAWTVAPTVVAVSEFNEEQLAQIRAEPKLLVADVEDITPAEAGKE